MEVYVVYYNPSDYPGLYVVRRQVAGRGTITVDAKPLGVSATLKEVRSFIPSHAEQFPRDPNDDSTIVEVWF